MIHRKPRRVQYTVIENAVLNDRTLSWKARGLLAHLLALPDDWEVSFAELLQQSPSDREKSLRSAFKELVHAGYARLEHRRSTDGKHAAGRHYTISEDRFRNHPPPEVAKTTTSGFDGKHPPKTPEVAKRTSSQKVKLSKGAPIPITEFKPSTKIPLPSGEGAREMSKMTGGEDTRACEASPAAGESQPPTPEQEAPVARSRRCPESFTPKASTQEWATRTFPGVDFLQALEAMRDHEYRDLKSDWDACLRTWIRREAEIQGRRRPAAAQAVPSLPPGAAVCELCRPQAGSTALSMARLGHYQTLAAAEGLDALRAHLAQYIPLLYRDPDVAEDKIRSTLAWVRTQREWHEKEGQSAAARAGAERPHDGGTNGAGSLAGMAGYVPIRGAPDFGASG